MVGLCGGRHDPLPTDHAGYLEFAQSLPTPDLYNAIKEATPLSQVHQHKGNENRLRAYERMTRYPQNFVVMGHAACAFNPVYAQGMTTAALAAQVLEHVSSCSCSSPGCLETWRTSIQRQIAQVQRHPWMMATAQDARYPQAQVQQLMPMVGLLNWYQEQLWQLLPQSPSAHRTTIEVIHMLKPPLAMVSPQMLWQVVVNLIGRPSLKCRLHLSSQQSQLGWEVEQTRGTAEKPGR